MRILYHRCLLRDKMQNKPGNTTSPMLSSCFFHGEEIIGEEMPKMSTTDKTSITLSPIIRLSRAESNLPQAQMFKINQKYKTDRSVRSTDFKSSRDAVRLDFTKDMIDRHDLSSQINTNKQRSAIFTPTTLVTVKISQFSPAGLPGRAAPFMFSRATLAIYRARRPPPPSRCSRAVASRLPWRAVARDDLGRAWRENSHAENRTRIATPS